MMTSTRPHRCLTALLLTCAFATPMLAAPATLQGAEGAELMAALNKSKFKFNNSVRTAYIAFVKKQTLARIKAAGKELPPGFLEWVNKDPLVEATVCARPDPAPMMMELCALWLDMGPTDAKKYAQLLLAAAVCGANDGPQADLSPRAPLIFTLPALPTDANPLTARAQLPPIAQTCAFLIRNQSQKFDGSENKAYLDQKNKEQRDAVAQAKREEMERLKDAKKNKGKKAKAEPPIEIPKAKHFTGKRKWPMFDLEDAPWPILTPLFENRLPLCEAEAIWQEFVQTGTVEYTEGITQDRSPFGPGSWQAMRRDENASRVPLYLGRDVTLGIPSMLGHHYEYNAICHFSFGLQSDKTCVLIPHSQMGAYMPQEAEGWPYGAAPARGMRPEYWRGSITYAMNRGLKEYLDASMALNLFAALPEKERQQHGTDLLESAVVINPYHLEAASALAARPATAVEAVDAYNAFGNALLAARKTGCPQSSAYSQAILGSLVNRAASLPVCMQKEDAVKVLGFLKKVNHPNTALQLRYQAVAQGGSAVRGSLDGLIDAHLTGARTPQKCRALAAQIRTAVASFDSPQKRDKWLQVARAEFANKEDYFLPVTVDNPYSMPPSPSLPPPNPKVVVQKIMTDEAAQVLAELSKNPLPDEKLRFEKFTEQITADLKKQLRAQRTPLLCQTMACQIISLSEQIKDDGKREAWLKHLAALIKGNESYLTLTPVKESALQFPDKILDDETDAALSKLLGTKQKPQSDRIEAALRQSATLFGMHVAGKRTGGSCAHMAKLVPALALQIEDTKQRVDWLKRLYRMVQPRSSYRITPKGPLYKDPSADAIYKMLEDETKKLRSGHGK